MNQSTDYTAHVQLPDAAIGSMFHTLLFRLGTVTFSALRVSGSTWLSFGVQASSDDEATMLISAIKYSVSRFAGPDVLPEGYEPGVVTLFETANTVVTSGRTVIHSEGI